MKPPHLVDAETAIKDTKETIAKTREEHADLNCLVAEALKRLADSVAKLKAIAEELERLKY